MTSKKQSARALAVEALEEARQDREKAIHILQQRMNKDPKVLDLVMRPWFNQAARQLISSTINSFRRSLTSGASAGNKDDTSGIHDVANTRWYDFVLPAVNKPLGDATREDIHAAAADYNRRSYDLNLRAVWLGNLAKKIKGRKIVRDTVSEGLIETLWNEVAGAHEE